MRQILLLGATGNLGNVLLKQLSENGYRIRALVRNPSKIGRTYPNVELVKGDVCDKEQLRSCFNKVDVIISVLGHGFRTSYPVQTNTMKALLPLMEELGVGRLIGVTGAAVKAREDKFSIARSATAAILNLVDPYRFTDAVSQQSLIEKSQLDWTIVRTPIHSNKNQQQFVSVGTYQPMPWVTVSRDLVARFIVEVIEENSWIRKSPIVF